MKKRVKRARPRQNYLSVASHTWELQQILFLLLKPKTDQTYRVMPQIHKRTDDVPHHVMFGRRDVFGVNQERELRMAGAEGTGDAGGRKGSLDFMMNDRGSY